jgi:phenylacetate-CoA ligase
MLFHESVGRRIGERAVFLWGSEREVLRGNADPKLRLLRLLANTVTVNSFRLTPEAILDFVRLINATRPKLIVGYAQSLFEVARFVGRESIGIEPQRAIIASAGTLYEFMRDAIEHALDCRVTNQYGSREVGPVALECAARSGLHVAPWNTHVEVLGPEGVPVGPGDEGELVITSLTNYAMPLLRYAVGDVGTLAQPKTCRCGHSGTTLARITGRVVDTFRTASGANVDGEYFTHLIYHLDWVEKFQVVQRTLRSVVFRIVLADHRPPPEPELERITAGTRAALGEDCEVDFEFVDELVPGPSGKFRFTISEVKPVE